MDGTELTPDKSGYIQPARTTAPGRGSPHALGGDEKPAPTLPGRGAPAQLIRTSLLFTVARHSRREDCGVTPRAAAYGLSGATPEAGRNTISCKSAAAPSLWEVCDLLVEVDAYRAVESLLGKVSNFPSTS